MSEVPDFWQWAKQVAFMTSDSAASFDALKAQWAGENPQAADAERVAAELRLANLLEVA